jgi:hypothetical protein
LNNTKSNSPSFIRPSEWSILYIATSSALILFFLFDGLTKVLSTYAVDFHRASLIIRTLYEVFFLILILSYFNRVRASLLLMLLSLFFVFLIGQLVMISRIGFYNAFWESIIVFNKYIFVFIVYGAICKLKEDPEKLKKCITVLEIIFIINSIAVLSGPLTQFEFLKTYINTDYRFGYMGFIMAQNEATLYYFLAVSLFYYKKFILKTPSKNFYVVLGAALLLGTKGIYAFLILLFLFHFIFKAKSKIWLLLGVLFFGVQLIHFLQSDKGKILVGYFYNENAKSNWFSMLLSGRDQLLRDNFQAQLVDWSPINYLTGGQNVLRHSTELDFFDLLLFFGLVGTVIFLSLYFLTVFRFRATLFTIFFVGCYFSLAFFGGHFFSSALNALYLCLICLYFYTSQERIKLQSE